MGETWNFPFCLGVVSAPDFVLVLAGEVVSQLLRDSNTAVPHCSCSTMTSFRDVSPGEQIYW